MYYFREQQTKDQIVSPMGTFTDTKTIYYVLPKTRRSYRKCTIYSSVYLDKVEVFVIVLDKVRLVLDALHGGVGVEGQLREPAAEPSVMMNNKNIN